jgi:uncharacterized protein DUF3300
MPQMTAMDRRAWRGRAGHVLSLLLVPALTRATVPVRARAAYSADDGVSPAVAQTAEPTPAHLQQLVAPIALYPDELVAQIFAAATFPDQVVEADRWLQGHNLQGQELAREVDAQPWDSSVKALTQFPSVLANMDKNLSWTSSLGDAYRHRESRRSSTSHARRSSGSRLHDRIR